MMNGRPDLLRVVPRRTSHTPKDRLAFVGDPPLFRPPPGDVSEVHISVSFTWDLVEAERLRRAWSAFYPVVRVGGPALGDETASAFVPGRYLAEGVTFTTRGCNRKCPWCLVPSREGRISEIENFEDGWIIQDNNFLQASQAHQARVFAMLRRMPGHAAFDKTRGVQFAGGIDIRLVNPWFVEQLKTIRLFQIFLAADTNRQVEQLEAARALLSDFSRYRLRVYTLIGFGNDTIVKATKRLERVWDLGMMPHAQLYQPDNDWIEYSRDWRKLAKNWSRPALTYALHKPVETLTAAARNQLSMWGGQ